MKPSNFPLRKKARQVKALAYLKAKKNTIENDNKAMTSLLESIAIDDATLRNTRSKKKRAK